MNKLLKLSSVTVFLAILVNLNVAQAILVKTETTDKVFEKAKLVKTVTIVNDDKTEVPMKSVSYGLRKKAVFGLVPVDVYVVQMFAADPTKLVKTEKDFLASIKNAGPVQLHFTFSRDLPGEKISTAFKEGLEVNGVDTKKPSKEIATALNEITNIAQFKEGQNFDITFTWSGETSTVHITDPSARIVTISGDQKFAEQLLSIWFGKPSDSRLADLKKTLIK